jgi:hypothetical protein
VNGKLTRVLRAAAGIALAASGLASAGAAAAGSAPRALMPAAAASGTAAGPRFPASSGSWGKAREVPGSGPDNVGGNAGVATVSCTSPGNCVAGGHFTGGGRSIAFAVKQRNGAWGRVRLLAEALNFNGAALSSVSCASAGNCSGGGFYKDASARSQGFVITETGGIWGTSREVPGLGTLNAGGFASVASVSCASAGNCAAGGSYQDASARRQAFVASEKKGTWGNAVQVATGLNAGGQAAILSVSCASVGNCVAGGRFKDASGHSQALVVGERNGTWGQGKEIPGTGALNSGGLAEVITVSCASAGNCTAGGQYEAGSGLQAFVVTEKSGRWGQAVPVARMLNAGGFGYIDSVSCASAGNCGAAGAYETSSKRFQAFVVVQKNGKWGKPISTARNLNTGGNASAHWVSCPAAGNCGAGGYYKNGAGKLEAFVVNEVNGTWHKAIEIPHIGTLNAGGNSSVTSLSCASANRCSAGGFYLDGSGHAQAFVVSER